MGFLYLVSSATFFLCVGLFLVDESFLNRSRNIIIFHLCNMESPGFVPKVKNQRKQKKYANNVNIIIWNDLWNKSTNSCKAVSCLFQFVLRGEHLYYYEVFFHFYTVFRHLKMLIFFYPATAFNLNIEIMILWLNSNLLISKVSSLWNRKTKYCIPSPVIQPLGSVNLHPNHWFTLSHRSYESVYIQLED